MDKIHVLNSNEIKTPVSISNPLERTMSCCLEFLSQMLKAIQSPNLTIQGIKDRSQNLALEKSYRGSLNKNGA